MPREHRESRPSIVLLIQSNEREQRNKDYLIWLFLHLHEYERTPELRNRGKKENVRTEKVHLKRYERPGRGSGVGG